ncbi:MAG: DUF4298 domain-containing protein [Flavobacteriaceae bacterium]|nr:DUF4298 domain-containing protein [Flavobacteriaceae bacterium]
MTEERLKRIQEMEDILDKSEIFFKEAETMLEKWKAFHPEFKKLVDYYYSPQWQEDYDASNRGEVPKEIPHGVLSEDLIYNAMGEQRDLTMAYLKYMVTLLDE